MAFLENQGVKIYWDEQGQGEPLLLIMGLSYPSYMWHRTRPALAARFRTIAFDNRGVGQSDVPPGPYTMPMMASDAASVLDAAGIASAHILGFSMGGMIAQEFALRHPQRVKSLILGCTSPGGPQSVQAAPEVVQLLLSRGTMTPAEANAAMIPFVYDDHTSRQLIDEDMTIRMKWYPTPEGYMAQLQAIFGWEAYSRIAQIAAPTLVIHGETDRLVPTENGKLIAAKIPGAKLVLLPQASHIFTSDQPAASHQAILEFLNAHSGAVHHAQA